MRTLQFRAAIVAGMAVGLVAASHQASTAPLQSPPSKTASRTTGKRVTLVGCVDADATEEGRFTLSEARQGATYRLTGTDMREFFGRRVQIVGAVGSNRVHVVGGLVPSPNAAAQAGALDPARSAREAASGTGAPGATSALPEFRVKGVRALSGSCP